MNDAVPPPATAPQPALHTSFKLSMGTKVGLIIFLLSGVFTLNFFPELGTKHTTPPPFTFFLCAGLAMVALTTLLFLYLGRLQLGLGRSVLVLALGYNAVIAIIKFALSPYALYLSNEHGSFDTLNGNLNSSIYDFLTAGAVLILYLLAFTLLYKSFTKRLIKKGKLPNAAKAYNITRSTGSKLSFVLATIVALVIGGVVIIGPLLFLTPSGAYISYIFSALALPLIIALLLALFLAYHAFAAVEQQVVVTGNATLLASFFWLGVSLIVLYHIMWVVFMLALIHIWPFNTYTPK